MKITEKINLELNEQINAELWSAYLYLSMSIWFDENNYKGMAHWMRLQAKEEQEHAYKILGYIQERGGNVVLNKIDNVKNKWKTVLEVFEESYNHEQKVTSMINKIMELAITDKDYATQNMLQWFIKEQVEEENSALTIVEMLRKINGNEAGLMVYDKELGAR